MTINIKKTAITSMIFLFMISLSFIAIQPIYESTVRRLDALRNDFLYLLEEKTDLSVSYESMSPSILTGLRVSRLQFTDTTSSLIVVKIASIRFSYNLGALFCGDFDHAFDSLVITGLSAEYDDNTHNHIFNKITDLLSSSNSSQEFTGLPFSVRINSATIAFKNNFVSIKATFKDSLIKNSLSGKSLQFVANSSINCSFLQDSFSTYGPITSNFSFQGTLDPALLDSAIQLRITELKNKQISINPIEVAVWYSNTILNLQILQNEGDFNFFIEWDLNKNYLSALLEADSFIPLSLIQMKKSSELINKLDGISVSGVYTADVDFNNNAQLKYAADGFVMLPPNIVPQGVKVQINARGNMDSIDINSLSVAGPVCDIAYEGNFDFNKLQPQGIITVERFTLPNNNSIQTEIYLDTLPTGFMGFIPQLQINTTVLTALQFEIIPDQTSIDFSVVFYDYSHYEYSQNAEVSVNGSLFLEDMFLQTNVEVSNLFFDSIFASLAYIMPQNLNETFTIAQKNFSTFVVSTEMYVSTDFKTISYNAPYTIIANTAKDQELAVLSFDGNEATLQVSQLDIIFAGQSLQASATADFSPDYKDIFFSSEFSINAIPYNLEGVFVDGKNLMLSGSYGLSSSLLFNSGSFLAGNILFDSFPFSYNDTVLSFSAQSSFYFNSTSDWQAEITRLELSEASGSMKLAPSLDFSGTFDSYGGMITSLTYSDTVSILNGEGTVMWDIVDGVFNTAQCSLSLSEVFSLESYSLDISLSNPFNKRFPNMNIPDDVYLSGQVFINSSPVSRFLSLQNIENTISAQVNVLGTLSNPSVSVSISDGSINMQGEELRIQSVISLDDNIVNIRDTNIQLSFISLNSIEAGFNLENFSGSVSGAAIADLGNENTISSPFTLSIIPTSQIVLSQDKFSLFNIAFPQTFLGTINFPLIESTQYGSIEGVTVSLIRSEGRFDVQGYFNAEKEQNIPINGYLLDTGECLLILEESLPVSFVAFGSIANGRLDIQVNDCIFDALKLQKIFDLGVFRITQGIAKGSFHLGGLLIDPEFTGTVDVSDFSCEVPGFIDGPIKVFQTQLTGQGKYLQADKIYARTNNGNCFADIRINFDKWMFDSVFLHLDTPNNERVSAFANLGLMEFSGDAECDLTLDIGMTDTDIYGSLFVDNAIGKIIPTALLSKQESNSDYGVTVDLDIIIGQHAQALLYLTKELNPIISALVNPMTPIKVVLNTSENYYSLTGDLVLRGGEVNIGRNFYLREGRLVFDQYQGTFDPLLSLRAELRETDENGELIRIILSAENQKLSTFNYVLSSSPPKSEEEIMNILGQSLLQGGSGWNLLGVGLNAIVQSTILKKVEDGLRDFLKLDILSLKTSVLQNTVRLYSEQNSGKLLTPGNFLDDTTVYIGKYFGDVLYGDFLLHLSYDDSKVDSDNLASGIAFEPEFGFEMESPIANIRWSIAPDVGSLHNLWVPYTSISLSWKFMF